MRASQGGKVMASLIYASHHTISLLMEQMVLMHSCGVLIGVTQASSHEGEYTTIAYPAEIGLFSLKRWLFHPLHLIMELDGISFFCYQGEVSLLGPHMSSVWCGFTLGKTRSELAVVPRCQSGGMTLPP